MAAERQNKHNYPTPSLLIDGQWRQGQGEGSTAVYDPARQIELGRVQHASRADLDAALQAVEQGFKRWRSVSAIQRQRLIRHAVGLLRERSASIARVLTLEQGKPLQQSQAEIEVAAAMIEWYADQAQRVYGRIIPSPSPQVDYEVRKEPIGPCFLLSPWNVPVILAARKIGGALAAGCSCIIKPPEETSGAVALMVQCFLDAGLPNGVLNMVLGVPPEVSSHILASPIIRKVSFTGSVQVGKQLARLAANHLQRVTLELGGHSPVIIAEDANLERYIPELVQAKFRNAGQLCHAPTRFFVHQHCYQEFVEQFAACAQQLRQGHGLEPETDLGPLANERRQLAMQQLVHDMQPYGELVTGGKTGRDTGWFFQPTIFADVAFEAPAMRDEPFGPVALIRPFDNYDEVLKEANASRYGLGAYLFTDSAARQHHFIETLQAGSIAINSTVASVAQAPFGGVRDSGYGYESGEEGLEGYLHSKFIHRNYDYEPN